MARILGPRERAIQLRKEGLSYSEIERLVPRSKSTLSLWLHSIELTQLQKKRLLDKQIANRIRHLGAKSNKARRIEKTKLIKAKAIADVDSISTRELWLMGTMLYWAEGHKQKEHNPSARVTFSNSDPKVIKLFLKWLIVCLEIPEESLVFEIYIHRSYKKTAHNLLNYWSNITQIPGGRFTKIRYKKNKIHSFRKNRGDNYYGVLRVAVSKSTDLNRKIAGWIEGVCLQCGVK